MGKRLALRVVTDEERQAVKRLAHARRAPARAVERAVERAQVVEQALAGKPVEQIASELGLALARNTVYLWWHRFEQRGLAGLEDAPRGGRPPTYTREQVGEIVATALTALTDPQTLDLPFQSWTLDRLVASLREQKGIAMQRSRRNDVLLTAGLRWRKQEGWFGERVAPDFAQKRGPSTRST